MFRAGRTLVEAIGRLDLQGLFPTPGMASLALAEPFGAPLTLRIGPVQNLVPAGEFRIVRICELLGDDALEVGGDDCLVERASFADDTVGKRDPALGAFGDFGKPCLAVAERQGPQIDAVSEQYVEGHIRGTVIPEQEFVEQRAASVIEYHEFAIEHIALR